MSSNAQAPLGAEQQNPNQHEADVEDREALQFWGYLFKPDKTGTDRLKGLLRGLKELMNTHYEPSEQPDLTPNQLAHFYRELHGNYDQLFLGTPSESIAFIYKSLGCLHSLQPLSHSTAFTDPTVPALKTEGWIMWQTIQLLLGPEEHSSFLMEAVQKWDVKDPATGETFPKILPRQCFPMEPDKHMVAWYEGVSERLRREADEEERQRDIEAQQAEVRRLQYRKRDDVGDDEESIDSRGPALAYFRNPLYRHVDGRPSILRRDSKRPGISPRPTTIKDRGKEAATTMGHVFRNIGSPNLWDGRGKSKSESRDRDRDHRRRSSLPNNRYHHSDDAPAGDAMLSPGNGRHHHRRRSAQLDRSPGAAPDDGYGDGDDAPPRSGSRHHSYRDDQDPALRHSRSHEPTPSQREAPDYFYGYDDPAQRLNSSSHTGATPPSANGIGPGFGPSASPLFASHVAKQPQPRPPFEHHGQPRKAPSMQRAQERPYSRSPGPRDRDDRHSRHRSSHERPRSRYDHEDGPPPRGSQSHQPGFPPLGPTPSTGSGSMPPPPSRDRRGNGRTSGSDVSYSGPDDARRHSSTQKKTRFAAGVDGRQYPTEGPWR